MCRTALLGSVVLLFATCLPALAGDGGPPPSSADAPRAGAPTLDPPRVGQPTTDPSLVEHQTLEAFGSDNPACMEWTDGCAVCVRPPAGTENHEVGCSLTGIACQPGTILCKTPVAAPH